MYGFISITYALAVIKGQLAVELIFQYETGLAADEGFQLDDLLEVINNSDINASKKQDIVQSMVDWCSCFEREAPVNGTFAAKLAEFISCNGLFEALPIRFAKDYKNEPNDEMTTAVYEVLEEQGIFEDISDDGITWTDCPLVTVDIKTFDSNDELPYDAPIAIASCILVLQVRLK